jgi:hypothetical protein
MKMLICIAQPYVYSLIHFVTLQHSVSVINSFDGRLISSLNEKCVVIDLRSGREVDQKWSGCALYCCVVRRFDEF